MNKEALKNLIDTAAGRTPADLVIRNGKVADVYTGRFIECDVAITDHLIAGLGDYDGKTSLDAQGQYIIPGLIDSHIHIESSFVSPEELGRLLVPHGTTTIIADPHEIVNVCGIAGLDYMLNAAKQTALDIKFMLPSCVPVTPFEHAGAVLDAKDMEHLIKDEQILGLGEFMNFPGVIQGTEEVLDKLMAAKMHGKLIDGHSPQLKGKELNAYTAGGIHTDHECTTVEEMLDRLSRGMYVMLRQGSACHDFYTLLKGLTLQNSRRCILCSDDLQPKSIFEQGHLEERLRICVEEGVDPMIALQMASLNAAECFRLHDRGGIAPGLRADILLVDDLKHFQVNQVFIKGTLAAEAGQYLLPVNRYDDTTMRSSFYVKDFSVEKLRLPLSRDKVYVIDINPGSILTGKGIAVIKRNAQGEFIYDPQQDIAKIAVIERHQNTGNVALGLIRGYGIRQGAISLSIAHDSHNIIAVGINDTDIAFAVEKLLEQNGGITLVKDGVVLEQMPLPLGGLMSDQSGVWVDKKLGSLHDTAYRTLGINEKIEPLMTLCFMSLAVIPELKLTDRGLFDVKKFTFIPIEADD